jgi:uncharacterized SAM-binding protein YcdF (DUF218 family)
LIIGDTLRRRLRPCLAAFFFLLLVAAAGVPVYVLPRVDPLRRADAILVLSGPHHLRYPFGFDLAEQGWAPNLVISNPDAGDNPRLSDFCAAKHSGVTVYCFEPEPATTKGEGRELRRLAAQYGWRTVIVVTFRPHVSRARFILQQCFDGDLVMVASPDQISDSRWAFEYLYQTAGYARAIVQPGC